EVGIRNRNVTGVQTCALPISTEWDSTPVNGQNAGVTKLPDGSLARVLGHIGSGGISIGDSDGGSEHVVVHPGVPVTFGIWALGRSEERRVGKVGGSRGARATE